MVSMRARSSILWPAPERRPKARRLPDQQDGQKGILEEGYRIE